jgi:hypothetical protein
MTESGGTRPGKDCSFSLKPTLASIEYDHPLIQPSFFVRSRHQDPASLNFEIALRKPGAMEGGGTSSPDLTD